VTGELTENTRKDFRGGKRWFIRHPPRKKDRAKRWSPHGNEPKNPSLWVDGAANLEKGPKGGKILKVIVGLGGLHSERHQERKKARTRKTGMRPDSCSIGGQKGCERRLKKEDLTGRRRGVDAAIRTDGPKGLPRLISRTSMERNKWVERGPASSRGREGNETRPENRQEEKGRTGRGVVIPEKSPPKKNGLQKEEGLPENEAGRPKK